MANTDAQSMLLPDHWVDFLTHECKGSILTSHLKPTSTTAKNIFLYKALYFYLQSCYLKKYPGIIMISRT